mgnify:CR=1 FL=1|jgi:site-specific recombinase XerD
MDSIKGNLVSTNLNDYLLQDNPLGAKSEIDVIQAWITYSCSNSEHTLKSYLKEIKRFLIYCDSVGLHYAHIKTDHINEYLSLLLNPDERWLKPFNQLIEPLKTQVLLKPLCLNSVHYAQTVLGSFYSYMIHAQVMEYNPVKLSVKIKTQTDYDSSGVDKALSLDAWLYLSQWLKYQSQNTQVKNRSKAVRDRWLMHFLYYTGMRRSSVVGLMMNCFSFEQSQEGRILVAKFKMKGNKLHKIIVSEHLLDELTYYRESIGLSKMPSPNEDDIAVIPSITKASSSISRSAECISSRGINFAIEQSLADAANDCEDYYIAEELRKATPHTFRHTCATHQLSYGANVVSTQKHLGHANINTTMTYISQSFDERVRSSKELSKAMRKDVTATER